ncbi:MAG: hypothetical protein AAF559_10330 [Pseudomonadota bacterium]
MRLNFAFLSPVAALGLLSACGPQESGTFTSEDGESGEYTIDTETGEATATIETDEGTATMRSGSNVPVDLPAGFSVYPGARVLTNTIVNQAAGSGALVTMMSDDSPEAVAAFYKQQAEDAGIAIQMDMATNGGKILGGQSQGGLTFSMIASPGSEGTTVQLTVGDELD